MKLEGEQKLLRIFIGEQDKWKGAPLYQAIVDEARALGLAGGTVIRGFMGYGCKAHVHTAKLLELSYDLPIIVEIVDSEAKISKLLPKLNDMVTEGLVTMEKVHVILYRADASKPRSKKGK
jgi:PII-like signaling protein